MKVLTIVLMLLLLSLIQIPIVIHNTVAQSPSYPPVFPFNGVTIISPSNGSTYNDSSLILKVNSNVQADIFAPHKPLHNGTVSANYSLDGSLNETMPVEYQYVQFGGGLFTGSVILQQLSEGSHTLMVFSKSEQFNVDTLGLHYPDFVVLDQRTVYFKVNLGIPPIIANLSIENKTYTISNLMLNFTTNSSSNDPTSWMGYKLDNQSITALTENKTLTGLSNGQHNISVYANDTFGNMGSQIATFIVKKTEHNPFTLVGTAVGLCLVAVVIVASVAIYRRKNKNRPRYMQKIFDKN